MKHWMFNCREISSLLSQTLDENTSWPRRMGIKFHLMMCRYCARFEMQLNIIHQTLATIGSVDAVKDITPMSDQRKQSIKQLLKDK